MEIKPRNLVIMAILTILTIGIYFIYWSIKTKNDLKRLGADIPTGIFVVIPIANIYFWYKYSLGYLHYIKKIERDNNIAALGSIAASFNPFLSMFVFQSGFNKVAKKE